MKKMILATVLIAGTAVFAQAGDFTLGLPGFFLSIGNECCGHGPHRRPEPPRHDRGPQERHHGKTQPGKVPDHHNDGPRR